ncbi:hypothetical protein GCM10009415_18400 [Chitinophaga japonensis]
MNQSLTDSYDRYVEAYDFNASGYPINAHPLTKRETIELARCLASSKDLQTDFLHCPGILPDNLLHLRHGMGGFAVWYTLARKVRLFFSPSLSIPNGEAYVPALLWRATGDTLSLYALKGRKRPNADTQLFHAPFFNVHENGNVCMGTADVSFDKDCTLESFIEQWHNLFYNTYFSHLFTRHIPCRSNPVNLWKMLVNKGSRFPEDELVDSRIKLKNLLA